LLLTEWVGLVVSAYNAVLARDTLGDHIDAALHAREVDAGLDAASLCNERSASVPQADEGQIPRCLMQHLDRVPAQDGMHTC
jgi:hypothetical protein